MRRNERRPGLRDKLAWPVAVAAIAVTGVLAWALLWPERGCAQPACARDRFALAIEVDAFGQVQPIEFEVPADNGRVSLQSILGAGGVEVDLDIDQVDLPYRESSGPLDRADLYQFASVWRKSGSHASSDATIYALLTTGLVSDNGEPLFGIMFDNADREAFALAPATTERFFGEHEAGSVATLQLRTFVHELLHTLNRHHRDAAKMGDGRLTLEAPTRCISHQERGRTDWSLLEPPLMAISPSTIRFFQTAPASDVLPGREGSPFDLQRISPTECEDARERESAEPALTRWQLARQRLQRLFSIATARAADDEGPRDSPAAGAAKYETRRDTDAADAAINLRIQALPAGYPLGYPVAVRVVARNDGSEPLPLEGRLDPGYGMVSIEYRNTAASQWQTQRPLAWFESIGNQEAMLAPGEQTEHTVPIYYDEQGWIFRQPGEYQVRARLRTDGQPDAMSAPVTVRVEAPRTDDDRAALQPLLDDNGRLDDRVGRLLMFGGRIGGPKDIAPLEDATRAYGHTALGAALRLTLISQRLRPPIDPLTGERPPPDLGDARELLEDTCTDSGVAALRQQLLERHAGALSDGGAPRPESGGAAWDGTTSSRGASMATYSDARLQPWGSSLHFCFDEAGLRASVHAAIPRLARQLRRDKPARIVLVGHADHEGACRRNDALARRRAHAVRRALMAWGVRGGAIEVAGLGERRPLDFATTAEAHALNRRVEVLVESETSSPPADGEQQRVMPRCQRPR
jgi:outer membrane protein OmpA-like peptidoglycan-associated protein